MNNIEVRKLPNLEKRIETGVMQFGDDWPCIVIRGDNALWYGQLLKWLLDGTISKEDAMSLMPLKGLSDLLLSCDSRLHKEEK